MLGAMQLWVKDMDIVFKLFEPEELECLVCGGTELDFEALQNAVQYDDGYTVDSQVCLLSTFID
jgi:hypothetical protein